MFETLDKLMFASLGAVSMTREKAEEIFDEYVQKGKQARTDKAGFVNELLDNAQKQRAQLEELVHNQLKNVIEKSNLATKDDIARLEAKIDALSQKEQ